MIAKSRKHTVPLTLVSTLSVTPSVPYGQGVDQILLYHQNSECLHGLDAL